MTTWTAVTGDLDKSVAETLAEAIEATDPLAVSCADAEDNGRYEVAAYYGAKPAEIDLMLFAAAHDAAPFAIAKLDDRDWVAQVQSELTPVRAGRFLVHGIHDRDAVGPSDISLEIEAAMAFGTGHHGTTLGCLELANRLARAGYAPRRIADIGTGTGILAMAGARLWSDARIIASDIEHVSVATARTNAAANKARHIRTARAMGFHHALHRHTAPYDLIFANILARPLRNLAPEMAGNLHTGGFVILSGILRRQGAGVLATYRGHGFTMIEKREIGEWVSFLLRRG